MTAVLDNHVVSGTAHGWSIAPSVAARMNELAAASAQARWDVNNWFIDVMSNCRSILGMSDVPQELLTSLGETKTDA